MMKKKKAGYEFKVLWNEAWVANPQFPSGGTREDVVKEQAAVGEELEGLLNAMQGQGWQAVFAVGIFIVFVRPEGMDDQSNDEKAEDVGECEYQVTLSPPGVPGVAVKVADKGAPDEDGVDGEAQAEEADEDGSDETAV